MGPCQAEGSWAVEIVAAHIGSEGRQKGRAHLMSLHTGNLILLVMKVWAFPLGILKPRILPGSISENTM